MDVLKDRIRPFVARYGTRLDIDVDMFEQLTGVELIYAISAKVNEAVGFDNETREMVEEFTTYIDGEWEELENTFDTNLVTTVDNKIDSLVSDGTMASLIGEHEGIVLIFGDSWTDPTSNTNHPNYYAWVNVVTSNPRIKTFGVGGATIAGVASQITRASNDTSFINDEVTDIFIVCGVNQLTNTQTLINNMNVIVESINSTFPNAKINWGLDCYTPIHSNYLTALSTCSEINTLGGLKCNFIPLPVILNRPIYYSNDENNREVSGHKIAGFHLSEKGSKIMERIFYGAISGNRYTPYIINSPEISLLLTNTKKGGNPVEFSNKTLKIKSKVESGSNQTFEVRASIDNITSFSVITGEVYVKTDDAPSLDLPLLYEEYSGGFYGCTINMAQTKPITTIEDVSYMRLFGFTFATPQPSGDIDFIIK